MLLLTTDYKENLSSQALHDSASQGNIVLIKNFLSPDSASKLRTQLCNWKANTPAYDQFDPYPKNITNFHMELKNKPSSARIDNSIDYHEKHTNFSMYNYRIGNMFDPSLQFHLPIIKELGPSILALFHSLQRRPDLIHGSMTGKNLYIEITHFPCGYGHIEKHTHQTILSYGQPINMLLALSKRNINYDDGGLFVGEKNQTFDLSKQFDLGDIVLLRNDIPHGVTPITGAGPLQLGPDGGRWTLTLFYY